jgi:hypothetical protein
LQKDSHIQISKKYLGSIRVMVQVWIRWALASKQDRILILIFFILQRIYRIVSNLSFNLFHIISNSNSLKSIAKKTLSRFLIQLVTLQRIIFH